MLSHLYFTTYLVVKHGIFFKVPPQPLWFTGEVANIRKLHELPYHLAHAGKWEELRQSVLGEV